MTLLNVCNTSERGLKFPKKSRIDIAVQSNSLPQVDQLIAKVNKIVRNNPKSRHMACHAVTMRENCM